MSVSQASRQVGFALSSAQDSAVFDRVEFVPLGAARVLVVIVAKGGHVVQKVIETGETVSADALRHASNYLNAEFSGLPLSRAREAILMRMEEERLLYDELMDRALQLGSSSFADLPGRARALRRRRGVAARRGPRAHDRDDACAARDDRGEAAAGRTAQRVHRRHWSDRGHRRRTSRTRACVRSAWWPRTYEDGTSSGTVGVIGPTRMRYSRAIAVVDGAAQAISRVLRDPD